jgi:hypothetical protein
MREECFHLSFRVMNLASDLLFIISLIWSFMDASSCFWSLILSSCSSNLRFMPLKLTESSSFLCAILSFLRRRSDSSF